MPNLNLKDDEVVHEEPITPRLRRRDEGSQNKAMIMTLYVVLILIVIGGALFFLNNTGIIKLWGSKPTVKRIATPPPIDTTAMTVNDSVQPEATPPESKKSEIKKGGMKKSQVVQEQTPTKILPPVQPAGSGEYAVQISSWTDQAKANTHVDQLREAGLDAYVIETATKTGPRWSVRVGRYASEEEAKTTAARLGENSETRVFVVKAQ
jgi:cell division septation protein DedD